MRIPHALSHSSLDQFETDPDRFYLSRLAEFRGPKEKQGLPASLGSGFDALAKTRLNFDLGITQGASFEEEFTTLFEKQVEPHNRDQVIIDCQYAFQAYAVSGAYDDLVNELQRAQDIRLETQSFTIIDGVPITGVPDLSYTDEHGNDVVHDWKCKCFYSKHGTSPTKYYQLCRDGAGFAKPSRSHDKAHPEYKPMFVNGRHVHSQKMEDVNTKYADQLSCYSWTLNLPIEHCMFTIEELVCRPDKSCKIVVNDSNDHDGDSEPETQPTLRDVIPQTPQIRVSRLTAQIGRLYQQELWDRMSRCWRAINSGHVFTDLSRQESDERCEMLENSAKQMYGSKSSEDQSFLKHTNQSFYS